MTTIGRIDYIIGGKKTIKSAQEKLNIWRIFGIYHIYCYLCGKNMAYDISKSIPQGGDGAYDEENSRIREISDELQRLCRLHETQPRNGQKDGSRHINLF